MGEDTTPTTDDAEPNDDTPCQLALDGTPTDRAPTSEEIKRETLAALADADGAFVVVGTLTDDHDATACAAPDCDGEAVEILTARWASDDLADDDREALMQNIQAAAADEAGPALMGGVVIPGDGGLLGQIDARVRDATDGPDDIDHLEDVTYE